jgi:hypothetical protein
MPAYKQAIEALALGFLLTACGGGAAGSGSDGQAAPGTTHTGPGGLPTGAAMPGTLPPTTAECPAFATGSDLKLCAATYLSGSGDDTVTAVDFAPDGSVLVAGSLVGSELGLTPNLLDGGGEGAVVRLSADGRRALSLTRIGSKVTALQISASTGRVAITGDFGVAVLDASAASIVWKQAVSGTPSRVAIAADGTVAALAGKSVSVFSAEGEALTTFNVSGSQVNDIAIDSGTESVFVVGFKQDDGAPCTQLQIPFLRAYDFSGQLRWKAYDWNRTEVGAVSECADSRGIAVALGRDGFLYYAAESHGGNTVHRREPQALSTMANVIKFDKFNDPYNMNGAAPVGFYARFEPRDGQLLVGQFSVTRLSNDKGNAARPKSIAADEQGNVLVVGDSACCIEGAADKTVDGQAAFGAYAGGAFLLVASADFRQRLQWTSLRGALGEGASAVAAAAGGGRMAFAIAQSLNEGSTTEHPLLTSQALQALPGGGKSDGFVAVWRSP